MPQPIYMPRYSNPWEQYLPQFLSQLILQDQSQKFRERMLETERGQKLEEAGYTTQAPEPVTSEVPGVPGETETVTEKPDITVGKMGYYAPRMSLGKPIGISGTTSVAIPTIKNGKVSGFQVVQKAVPDVKLQLFEKGIVETPEGMYQAGPTGTPGEYNWNALKKITPNKLSPELSAVRDMLREQNPGKEPTMKEIMDKDLEFSGLKREDTKISLIKKAQAGDVKAISELKKLEDYDTRVAAASGQARAGAFSQTRQVSVLDTKFGNIPVIRNMDDINKENDLAEKEGRPPRYISAGAGVPALNKTALLEDIRGNIQMTRESLPALPSFNATQRAKFAAVLSKSHQQSEGMWGRAKDEFLSGSVANTLTPQQMDYVTNIFNLVENSMAMRSVLGAGQGSDELRAAIKATIPGAATPNKQWAEMQLTKFEKTLDRLGRAIPQVPLRGEAPSTAPYTPYSGGGIDFNAIEAELQRRNSGGH